MPQPLTAKGEYYGRQPSDVLLTFRRPVSVVAAANCVAVTASRGREAFGGAEALPSERTLRLYLLPSSAMPSAVQCAPHSAPLAVSPSPLRSGGVVSHPIDSSYLAGEGTLTVQPWRSYLDTSPSFRLTSALGINFNVTPKESEDTAQLLQESGFTLARVEIGWNSLSYEDPSAFKDEAGIDERLQALRKHHIRPLILLNANSGEPNPTQGLILHTTEEAAAGARTVTLTPESAADVVPGRTGFDDLTFGGTPDLLIASISGDVATLAQPLPNALPAGAHRAATLLYPPFGPPRLADGESNPAFQETLSGWLAYVSAVTSKADGIFGPEGYDLEVWNELGFGSQYLNQENYYTPSRESGEGSVEQALLQATVAYIRNPQHHIPAGVGIADGFASQTPYVSGATVPAGTTAISKHLYAEEAYLRFHEGAPAPQPQATVARRECPRFLARSSSSPPSAQSRQRTFHIQLPEYFLTGLAHDTIVRDLAPFTSSLEGVPHGRDVAPGGGAPPQVWMTEYNLQHSGLLAEHEGDPNLPSSALTPAQAEHLQAVVALRSFVAMINMGMSREYFYAVAGEGWNLVSEAFLSAVDANPSSYPGAALGGETMDTFRRLIAQMQGVPPSGPIRQLSLLSIAQANNHAQLAGALTPAGTPLYDRDVLAVLPFQSSPTRFVIPVYVMSDDITAIAKPQEAEGSIYRFDLPSESFRITLGNLPETADPPAVSAYDPIRGEATPARLISRDGSEATFEIAATDYPRLLEIEYGG
jgi:hypothetical protein